MATVQALAERASIPAGLPSAAARMAIGDATQRGSIDLNW